MELVVAILAGQLRQAPIRSVHHTVANETLLDAFHLRVDVRLPEKNSADNVAIARLDQVANG